MDFCWLSHLPVSERLSFSSAILVAQYLMRSAVPSATSGIPSTMAPVDTKSAVLFVPDPLTG